MERIKKIELNGITFEVFGQYWETRNSWGHNGYLLQDGREIARDKIRYYNRTWEAYRFQSAGRGAVYNWLKQLQAAALERYREAPGQLRPALHQGGGGRHGHDQDREPGGCCAGYRGAAGWRICRQTGGAEGGHPGTGCGSRLSAVNEQEPGDSPERGGGIPAGRK